ncbi:MAG: hypothetical protein E7324_09450 [Clostridiales bacterium]|nr:hypothetical protein [Clostridiales bacterium]
MKNRKWILSVCLVLALTMSLGGTLAYLTDTDSDVNVMTLGNVSIEQIELQRKDGVDHNAIAAEGDLVPFEQGQPLYPAYPVNGLATDYSAEATDLFTWGPYVTADNDENQAANGLWNDNNLKGAMDKFVFVKNTGSSPAYFRTWVAFECPEEIHIGEPAAGAEIMINVNAGYDSEFVGYATLENTRYAIFCFTYTREDGVLPAGEIARPSLLQVVLTHHATNEDMKKLGDTYEILALSQAVQTTNFDNAEQALTAAFGAATIENLPWTGDVVGIPGFMQPGTSGDFLTDEEYADLMDKFAQSSTIIGETNKELLLNVKPESKVIDCNGTTVVLNGDGAQSGRFGYLAFIPDPGEDVTVSNLNVTGAGFVELGHYGMGGGNYVANNLLIENLNSTLNNGDKGFNLGCAFSHYGTATLNNCVITGTTALKDGVMPVDLGCVNGTTTTINGGKYGVVYCWSHANVTINGAEIDTLQVAPINGTVTVKAGTQIDTINIAYGTSTANETRLAKLVIEDGASVDKIVFEGNTYTLAQWQAR